MASNRLLIILKWNSVSCLVAFLIACPVLQTTNASQPIKTTEQSASSEIILLKLEAPPRVQAEQRFPITIFYKSAIAPNDLKERLKYVNIMRECGDGHTFNSKINKKQFITVTESSITVDSVYYSQPREKCTLKVFIEHDDSDNLRETNTVTSNSLDITKKQ